MLQGATWKLHGRIEDRYFDVNGVSLASEGLGRNALLRHLAASGPMPPGLACKFTVSELAVLRIIGDEVRQHGHCDRCVDEIAARAGVCRRMVQTAIREAARLGLLTIEERRREGRRNLPNVVRIVSKEWTSWLARGGRSSCGFISHPAAEPLTGCKKLRPTDKSYKTQRSRAAEAVLAARGQQAGSAVHHRKGTDLWMRDMPRWPGISL